MQRRRLLICLLLSAVASVALSAFAGPASAALYCVGPADGCDPANEYPMTGVGLQAALNLLSNPGRLLSVTQVGVTLASLGLGWAGEDTLYALLVGALKPVMTPVTVKLLHGISFLLSFLIISYCHVVIGEVVPKNLAIADPRMTA